ncbi:hypothetical protein ACIRU3_30785, partial [Streptomyces sp. NPDC101151]
GHGPENMATLRNTALNRLRATAATNMTEAVRFRWSSGDAEEVERGGEGFVGLDSVGDLGVSRCGSGVKGHARVVPLTDAAVEVPVVPAPAFR